jgi:ribosomal protein L17
VEPNIVQTEQEIDLQQKVSVLLDRLRDANSKTPIDPLAIQSIESEIIGLLDGYLRESLLPVVAKMFGPQVYRKDRDSSARFTVMMNELFVKLLQSRSELTRFEDARHLRNWCSRVIRRQMLNHIKKKQKREEIFQAIAPLYEAQKSHFEKRFGIDTYDRALAIIESWEKSPYHERRLHAALLSQHYILGASWDEVGDALGIGRTVFYEQRNAAVEALGNDL